jgi:hypothetical protein
VEALLLKLVLTPALVGGASLAGRRWGSEFGGWLVGIPFTSGPIALFLALGPGVHFAATASVGILGGAASQAAFAMAYAWTSTRLDLVASLAAATVAFLAVTVVLNILRLDTAPTLAIAVASLVAGVLLMPRRATRNGASPEMPWWDIPARMVVATAFVVALTAAAPALGARLAGLLAPFPVYATVLTVFAHRLEGSAAAISVLRGLILGLFSFAGFFLSLAALLVPQGIAVAFAVAVVAALAIQAATLFAGRRWDLA